MATLSTAEKSFLKQLVNTVRRPLSLAWLLTVISTLIFVWQAWLLASLFSLWLTNYFNKIPLSTGIDSAWFIGLALCFVLRPLLNMGRELLSSRASLKVRSQLRQSLLSTMATLGPNLRHFGSDGSISSQIIDQTDALDGFISRFSVQKNVTVTTPLILLIAVAWQSKFAAALLLMTAPLVPIFMILIGHLTAKKSAAQFSALSQLSGRFLDWIRGMPTLKRLQATSIAEQDLAISSEEYRRRTMDVLKIAFLNGAVLELLAALSIALVAVYLGFGLMGILPWDKGHVPVAYFGALFILLLAPEFYVPLRQLGADYHAKAEAEGAVQSLLPIIKAAQLSKGDSVDTFKVGSEKDTSPEDLSQAPIDLSQAFGLTITNVSIQTPIISDNSTEQYLNPAADGSNIEGSNIEGTDAQAADSLVKAVTYRTRLAPVSFELQPAQRIALTGDSGSGKSSLLQAIMGFVDYQGTIEITLANSERIDIKQLPQQQLRQHMGYLAQQVALMPLTIAENLRLANPNATDQQLIDALKEVELWQLIERLPQGVNTQLGDRGQGLSGGQQQRLGIAQLLLRNDSLWLLDEPTEHLDPDTAQRIHQLLQRVSIGKTVIWITHAYETLSWLDRQVTLSLPVALTEMGGDYE
ncbi:thiol reductant ABC exporter subunit CydD [Psychrobacter sanguinis]|uniref:thiol reductant ABC exporter subunit CydD n=1 Tax=Psychrobacter sanguinis TaxID=861445 RepID=UPI00020C7A10|nr:thiol reductant ABC exporter subunit CydD [Psychrobacter sanguinis]EGK14099.1 ABC superfamily ATP binding cassette transporter, ABC protein [Psychrobacter sp. 1501(2011)]MCD9150617.1 thiol reductant ABC exporter subunit CydD [Psychrobacter sanguinis]